MLEYIISGIALVFAIVATMLLNRKINGIASRRKNIDFMEHIRQSKLLPQMDYTPEDEESIPMMKPRGRPPAKEQGNPKKENLLNLLEQLLQEVKTM
jgi:hypothetical protein